MAAMVGGATGAAMTAVTMIFEMTRDYDIVMPLIIAVAVSIGVRRLLSQENIYTIKLMARRHFIPKALHANMFLVRQAGEVMDKDPLVLRDDMRFDAFLRLPDHGGRMRHVVITHEETILGVLRVNTALRYGLEGAYTSLTLGEVAIRHFTTAGTEEVMFDVIGRRVREHASMIIVFRGPDRDVGAVAGLITKEHIADSVSESIGPYAPGQASAL
jgi:CIC family chloride channel protein